MTFPHGRLRVGISGPVGSGKTALMDALCRRLRDDFSVAAITNNIYTREDADFLTRFGACRPNGTRASRPGDARIPRSARTPR